MSCFVEIARDAFAFLEKDYGFACESSSDESWGGQLLYRNLDRGVGVKLLYEFRSAFVFVFVYRLVGGQMIDNSLPIRDDSEITCFDFNDMLNEQDKMKRAYDYGEESVYYDESDGLKNYVMEFAIRLKTEGAALLGGDFSRLPEVEKIIKARARQL